MGAGPTRAGRNEPPPPDVPPGVTSTRPLPSPGATGPVRLALPGRTLLLVAGLPGAGKSTLLGRLPAAPGVVVLDSERQRAALARWRPRLPYRAGRPLLHLLHRLAVLRAALSAAPTVVVHLPATRASTRAAVAALAALTRRTAHLLWLHATPDEALAAQRRRGRAVPSRSFARHVARVAGVDDLQARLHRAGWRTVTVVEREQAGRGLVLATARGGSGTPGGDHQ